MTALENISFTAPLDVKLNVYKLHKDPSNVLGTATVPCLLPKKSAWPKIKILKTQTGLKAWNDTLLSLTAGSRQNKPATWVVSAGYFLVFCVFLRQIICSCTGADI